MKKSTIKREEINIELSHIIQLNRCQNKLLKKIIDKLEKPLSSESKEKQHQKL